MPLVIFLDDPGATLGTAGGKGASLARLARAGFRVPPGFHVTTGAYHDFLGGGLREDLLEVMSAVDPADEATFETASARIGELFAAWPVPLPVAAAITKAYASLSARVADRACAADGSGPADGADLPVAVRSSATSEDLPGLSAAGQHDSYLNVRGESAVVEAVRRCWTSLWSARAIGYRARHGINPGRVSIAVVVQEMVPADAAGVLFTVDPVSGSRDTITINATRGLGESLVAGEVTGDVALVGRSSGELISYQGDGARALTPGQAEELARTGLYIEKLYGEPADVEWALADDDVFVLQARPVTAAGGAGAMSAETRSDLVAISALPDAVPPDPLPSDSGPPDSVVSDSVESDVASPDTAVDDVLPAAASEDTAPMDAVPPDTSPSEIVPSGAVPPEAAAWNDSLDGDYLWSNGNLGEAIPDVMTPVTWSLVEIMMTRMTFPPVVGDYRGYGRIGGRFYVNVSMSIALEAAAGITPRRLLALVGPVLGKVPPPEEIPTVSLPRWQLTRQVVPALAAKVREIILSTRRLPRFLADTPERCDELRAEIGRTADPAALAALWQREVRPLFEAACSTLAAVTTRSTALLTVPGKLVKMIGVADAALLLTAEQDSEPTESGPAASAQRPGRRAGDAALASLGPALGLARLARGEIDRDAFTRQFGHRSDRELELSAPRPAEDPAWIESQLAAVGGTGLSGMRMPVTGLTVAGRRDAGGDATVMLADREEARAVTWERLDHDEPKNAARARTLIARWARIARDREAARSEVARTAWAARAWVLRAGELTGHGDDLFFLSLDEIVGVLRGDPAPLARVPARRAAYDTYRALPRYPALIRGRFDPVRWAADPDRRGDFYDERDQAPTPASDTIEGFPGAAGVVEGIARILTDPADAARLAPGEVLVTTVTNIGWTPVFPRAAAVVTDVGAPLSHAAIVARELGIPAVVGCGNATTRLHDGDRVRVDGTLGTVEVALRGA